MSESKKILCIGDSLALPGHLNSYEDTWFYKIKNQFPDLDFISFFKRQLTTDVLVSMGGGVDGVDKWPKGADCLEAFEPNIAIIQLGIVDCAPRLLTVYDKMIIHRLPNPLQRTYINSIKRLRKRSTDNTLVSFLAFKENLENYLDRAKRMKTRVLFISISIPDERMVRKNKDILINVFKYNEHLKKLDKKHSFVEITKPLSVENCKVDVYEDGYHPNTVGHGYIADQITKYLMKH